VLSEPSDLLPVVRACELDEPALNQRWLVDSLWARAGVGVIGGSPKSCKSWLALDIALSVVSSTPCLGRFEVHDPGPVLVYFAEDPPGLVRQRLASGCSHRALDLEALPLHVITAPSVRLDLRTDQQRLDRTLAALSPRLLIVDPFVRLHRINENDAGEVSGLLAFLREMQRKHDLAVIVVHHTRKNGPAGGQAGQGLRGSGDFHAWTDSALYLRRKNDQLLLTIEHRAAPVPDPLTLALTTSPLGHVYLDVAGAAPETPITDLSRRILETIDRFEGGATRDALRSALRVRNQRLGAALAELTSSGQIIRTASGWARSVGPVPTP